MLLVHALVGWALCAAIMGIGLATTSLENALIAHAIGAPSIFAIVSLVYFTKVHATPPLQTAVVFLSVVVALDVIVVAVLVNRSFEMFTGLLGTWLPFALIFTATYVTGRVMTKTPRHDAAAR
jgi:hypothetical protein